MGLSLSLSQGYYQQQRLNQKQKLGLKHLFALQQTLIEGKSDHRATKGFEGMKIADEILKERGARGVLIGGLSEFIWNQRRKIEDLLERKDVDVAVLDESFELEEPFEGGIDWWLAESDRITLKDDYSNKELNKTWHKNENGIVLFFSPEHGPYVKKLKPGLYIPSPDWISNMRTVEIKARVDEKAGVTIDDNVIDRFRNDTLKKMGTALPKFITDQFPGQILASKYGEYDSMIDLNELDLPTIVAINSR